MLLRIKASEEFGHGSTEILDRYYRRRIIVPHDIKYYTELARTWHWQYKHIRMYGEFTWLIITPDLEQCLTHNNEEVRLFAKKHQILWNET